LAKLTVSKEPRRKVAVISHERSGTHFLMNTLAANFGYIAKPWWNFDFGEAINFHSIGSVERYLRNVHGRSVLNVLKSHHAAGFFEPLIDYFAAEFQVFYIHRDPHDALVSNWKLIRSFGWDEGPKPETASEFLRAEPASAMLRYQKRQERNMVARWRSHVEGWLDLADGNPDRGICVLRYEDLNLEFDETVERIGRVLERDAGEVIKPAVDQNVIGAGQGTVGGHRDHLCDADLAFIAEEAGPLLARLGYAD